MLPILDSVDQAQIPAVFPVALMGIAGQGAENDNKGAGIGKQRHHQHRPAGGQEHGANAQHQTDDQNQRVELVRTIASLHKSLQAHSHFKQQPGKPAGISIHGRNHLIARYTLLLYLQILRIQHLFQKFMDQIFLYLVKVFVKKYALLLKRKKRNSFKQLKIMATDGTPKLKLWKN